MAAAALTPEQIETRLRRYMTPAGYELALTTFGESGIADAVAENGDRLRLAAAELLEGLPAATDSTDSLSSFKLDVLEFKFRDASKATDWAGIASRLRTQEGAQSTDGTAMFPPVFDEVSYR